ncbi:unnamed protein product [Amoebophrya sp. A120]|nr:unnamed protein product [Amoebophrya sp. A120]|eukprot:GSA120T00006202001.1
MSAAAGGSGGRNATARGRTSRALLQAALLHLTDLLRTPAGHQFPTARALMVRRRGDDLPLATEVETAHEQLEESGEAGAKAARTANTVAAVLKIKQHLNELATITKATEKQAVDMAHRADSAGSVEVEMVAQRNRAATALDTTVATLRAFKKKAAQLVATAESGAEQTVTKKEEPTVQGLQQWKLQVLHDPAREAQFAFFTASKPYKQAGELVAAAVGKLRAKAAAADREAFAVREQASSYGKTAGQRIHPFLRNTDVAQVRQLQAKADALSLKGNKYATEADKFALLIPKYAQAADWVGAEAAQRIDPTVVLPPFTYALPPIGGDLQLPGDE